LVPSDALELQRRQRRRSPGRVLLVTLIVVAALFLAWRVVVFGALEAHFGSGYDDRRFDKLETQFDHGQAAFAKADAGCRSWRPPTRRPNGSPGA
jgi:ferric-dicitrate binding protein FerR (iron transport regulator)